MEATLQVEIAEVQVVRHMDTLAPADVDTTALAAVITTAEASGVRSCATPARAAPPRHLPSSEEFGRPLLNPPLPTLHPTFQRGSPCPAGQ